ncbi:hypothetical protein F4820DRAFT_414137 [Hypoxylon rubiginosum]|uniref:Uncharacterized protein n=1 Tax=Hypoxylon rubiginosum TaxID=110542 RepID=A0ACB9Z7S1_9PEZI|nr:hypothetical protein F4820DRAFT_414137 [Hypoxylon rubiginosum]
MLRYVLWWIFAPLLATWRGAVEEVWRSIVTNGERWSGVTRNPRRPRPEKPGSPGQGTGENPLANRARPERCFRLRVDVY